VTAIPSPSILPSPPIVDDPIPCTMFDRFPKLPAELRLKIWQFALPGRLLGENAFPVLACFMISPLNQRPLSKQAHRRKC
jgi:hypothetical protein